METTGQGRVVFGDELSHAAVQHNGYWSVKLPVPPTSEIPVTGRRLRAGWGLTVVRCCAVQRVPFGTSNGTNTGR